jgi:hypothetical protein
LYVGMMTVTAQGVFSSCRPDRLDCAMRMPSLINELSPLYFQWQGETTHGISAKRLIYHSRWG